MMTQGVHGDLLLDPHLLDRFFQGLVDRASA